jgi:hypothetical protein
MVDISIAANKLLIIVEGWDKLWAFKGSLEIPLAHVKGAYPGLEAEHGLDWTSIRAPGTFLPGVITAGTFYQHGKTVFWDVHNREKTVAIELHDERYNLLVVEVADPDSTIKIITGAIAG